MAYKKTICIILNIRKTDESQTEAGVAGGIEAVVKAINTHISNSGVCENGCGALWNMTDNGKNTVIKQHK